MLHIKKIKPMFTSIVTTADVFEKDYKKGGIITAYAGDIKPWQKVVAVGTSVRDIKEGDMVMVNLANYVVRKYDKNSLQNDLDNNPKTGLRMNYIMMDDEKGKLKEYFLLNDRDILYSFEGEEKEDENLILPFNKIIGVK